MTVRVQITSMEGKQTDGPAWITAENGNHVPVETLTPATLNDLGDRMVADSERWFPKLHETDHSAAVHFALGLAGEVGELVNLVKKVNRGSTSYVDVLADLAYEVADVLVYLLDLARVLGIDVDRALAEKHAICEARWGS
jgi:NTP pyrophosphatase (non-canonical NTP hydrolase)